MNLWINSFAEQSVDKLLVISELKCRIPLLTKFAMMELKIGVLSISMILL